KNIFTFSAKGQSDYSYTPLPTDDPTNFYDASELTTEDLFAGFYALTEKAPATIVEDFYNRGMKIKHESAGIFRYLIFGVFLKTGNLFVVLVLCTITALLFYKFSQRKKIGILQFLGQRPAKLIVSDVLFDTTVILLLFLVFSLIYPLLFSVFLWLSIGAFLVCLGLNIVFSALAYNIGTISDRIKGRKPYKQLNFFNFLVKAVLFAFIVFNTASLTTQQAELKQLKEQFSVWQGSPDYYSLEFSVGTSLIVDFSIPDRETRRREEAKINQRLLPLLEKSEKSGALLVHNNEIVHSPSANFYTDKRSMLTVNHNFLSVANILDTNEAAITALDKNYFYILIPENEKENEQRIVEEVEDRILLYQNFYAELSDGYQGDLKVLYTKSNQQVFNYNHRYPELGISDNPIILVLDLSLIQPNIEVWISDITGGYYLFTDAEEVKDFIKENDMEKDFFSLTAVKDAMYHELQQAQSDYFITWILLVLLFLSFIAIELYITLVYFEANRKRLFLRFIFGDHFFSRYAEYFLSVIGLSAAVGAAMVIWKEELFPWVLFFLAFELCLLICTTWITEKRMRLEVIKND
ncbi:bacteriocin-associated integral membrane protein, partial [Enterococcus faecalis 13-SD-W-01]